MSSEQEQAEFFSGLRVPEGNGRRELYRSQYRLTFAYKVQLAEIVASFEQICKQDGWQFKDDDRVDGVGSCTVSMSDFQRHWFEIF